MDFTLELMLWEVCPQVGGSEGWAFRPWSPVNVYRSLEVYIWQDCRTSASLVSCFEMGLLHILPWMLSAIAVTWPRRALVRAYTMLFSKPPKLWAKETSFLYKASLPLAFYRVTQNKSMHTVNLERKTKVWEDIPWLQNSIQFEESMVWTIGSCLRMRKRVNIPGTKRTRT